MATKSARKCISEIVRTTEYNIVEVEKSDGVTVKLRKFRAPCPCQQVNFGQNTPVCPNCGMGWVEVTA